MFWHHYLAKTHMNIYIRLLLIKLLFLIFPIKLFSQILQQNGSDSNNRLTVLRVEITNIANMKCDVGCDLYKTEAGYPEDFSKAYKTSHVPISCDNATCEFQDISNVTYAVAVFQDENGNGKMDKNLFGIPIEGYGSSNNIRPTMSAPAFKESSFKLNRDDLTTLKIKMGY